MHHFTGSTLEAKIQNIILLKHHFTGSFLKKKSPAAPFILLGHHFCDEKSLKYFLKILHFTGTSFYRVRTVVKMVMGSSTGSLKTSLKVFPSTPAPCTHQVYTQKQLFGILAHMPYCDLVRGRVQEKSTPK